jgi:hypothetical protein
MKGTYGGDSSFISADKGLAARSVTRAASASEGNAKGAMDLDVRLILGYIPSMDDVTRARAFRTIATIKAFDRRYNDKNWQTSKDRWIR